MNWTWQYNFIQKRLQNVEASLVLLSFPDGILQLIIFLIKIITVIMYLLFSEVLNFGHLTSDEQDIQKLQLHFLKVTHDFVHLVTCMFHLILTLSAYKHVFWYHTKIKTHLKSVLIENELMVIKKTNKIKLT